jgi:ABC-2 type transport system permease protein
MDNNRPIFQRIRRYGRLIYIFTSANFQRQLAYRPSFFLAVIGKILRMALLLLFFNTLFQYTPLLAGWKYQDIFLLFTIYLTVESMMISTFHRNLSFYLPELLRKGSFDFLLTKPVSSLWYASFRVIDLMDLTSALFVIYLWIYYFVNFGESIGFVSLLFLVFWMGVALFFIYSLLVIISSTAFWTINATGIGRLFEDVVKIGRYPTNIFQGALHVIVLFIFPIGIIANLPADVLLHRGEWWYVGYALLFCGIIWLISRKIWQLAMRRYSSASS